MLGEKLVLVPCPLKKAVIGTSLGVGMLASPAFHSEHCFFHPFKAHRSWYLELLQWHSLPACQVVVGGVVLCFCFPS